MVIGKSVARGEGFVSNRGKEGRNQPGKGSVPNLTSAIGWVMRGLSSSVGGTRKTAEQRGVGVE